MGFAISWLVPCRFGVDGFTALNLTISKKTGLSFGTWQAVLNCILFLIVIIVGRQYIGLGTVANMLLVGYTCDFFSWVWDMVLPPDFFDSFLWNRKMKNGECEVRVLVPSGLVQRQLYCPDGGTDSRKGVIRLAMHIFTPYRV